MDPRDRERTIKVTMLDGLGVKMYVDGADIAAIAAAARDPLIKGFTTNPTLMRQAGVDNYEQFARKALEVVNGKPISFEVTTDDSDEMYRQARRLSALGDNVYVKIPVTNCSGASSDELIERLAADGISLNVTAIFTPAQVDSVVGKLLSGPPSYVSVFAGRIADTGVDPMPIVRHAVEVVIDEPQIEVIWASSREVLNVIQAAQCGCHIITLTNDLLRKLPCLGRDLSAFSLETVQMFRRDALAAGYEW